LVTTVTRLCINHLRLARTSRETYIGPWLPEAVDRGRFATVLREAVQPFIDIKIVTWQTNYMIDLVAIQAISNERRLRILQWLKDPEANFRPQVDGDLVRDGVCAVLIAAKLGISQPTLSEHMRVLCHAGLLDSKKIKQWTFYKRNEARIKAIKRSIANGL
jgi:DNA-binding transcriptional ArsR family regulator